MALAYIVSAYKLPEQLTRLVLRLSTEDSWFFIHVDRKTDDDVYRRMTRSLASAANVRFLPRHACHYGGFGHVQATLKGIDAIVRGGLSFDHTILLTGQDYPLKSNAEIHAFFRRRRGRSFMEHFSLPTTAWVRGGIERITVWHVRVGGRHLRLRPRPRLGLARQFPAGLRPFGGSSYWCLSRDCTGYVHEFVRQNRRYTRFFRFVDVPDELFFQTIVLNSPFRDDVVNDDLRYLEWRDPRVASGPAVLESRDFGKLASSGKLFARKFDAGRDSEVLDLLDVKIGAAS